VFIALIAAVIPATVRSSSLDAAKPIPQMSAVPISCAGGAESGVAVREDQKHSTEEQRRTLLELYDAAVKRAHPSRCLPGALPEPPPNGRIIIAEPARRQRRWPLPQSNSTASA